MRWCLACGAVQPEASSCQACGGSYYWICKLGFGDLYHAYAGPLRRFVRRLAADRGLPESLVDIDGVVHDTFIALLSGSGQPIRNPGAWLVTVARNQVSKAAAAQRRIAPGDPADHLHNGRAAWASLASPPADAEDIRVAREVMRAIAGLPDHQRIATYLRQVQGWSLAEVGAYLNCAASTVGVHISRGTAKVRGSLFGEHTSYLRLAEARDSTHPSRRSRIAWLRSALCSAALVMARVLRRVAGFLAWMLLITVGLRALGMPWWPATVAALAIMVAAMVAVGLWLWLDMDWRLWAEIDARRYERRFNRWLRTGRALDPPGGTRQP